MSSSIFAEQITGRQLWADSRVHLHPVCLSVSFLHKPSEHRCDNHPALLRSEGDQLTDPLLIRARSTPCERALKLMAFPLTQLFLSEMKFWKFSVLGWDFGQAIVLKVKLPWVPSFLSQQNGTLYTNDKILNKNITLDRNKISVCNQ